MNFNRACSIGGAVLLIACSGVFAQVNRDFWDRAPIRYSETASKDSLTELAKLLESDDSPVVEGGNLGALEYVLKYLEIPEESQVLVFSKTSLQNDWISPKNPRSFYFSENAYVGYVPGGAIEAIVQDAFLGPVFYMIGKDETGSISIERDQNRCFTCHATARTEGAPGMLIRSVYPGEGGHPQFDLGSHDVDYRTPLAIRWGGWYVTGSSALPHLGNRIFSKETGYEPKRDRLDSVAGLVDTSGYLRDTSDIVALLVLEHQVKMHSLLNAASMNYRRSLHFMKILDPDAEPDSGSAGKVAESWADDIVDGLFFKDEADLGDGVEGDPAFQKAFLKRFPKSSGGDSLADFRLYRRIFKNRCSYMVYSDAFKGLPVVVKTKVISKMKRVLSGEADGFNDLNKADRERARIDRILTETLPGWK
jgi:hypothetical protein